MGLFRRLSDHVFGVRNFGYTKSMRVIDQDIISNLFLISKMHQEIEKKFFVSEIIASELVSLNSL